MSARGYTIDPETLLRAYRLGFFPMAETRESTKLHFLDPEQRGVLPLDGFHLTRRLARTARRTALRVTADADFPRLIALCAQPRPERPETWINREIERLFCTLAAMGHAHSIEVWEGDRLVGGLYGLAIGGAFFGESMVSLVRDASKLALVHLVARLRLGGFLLLDTQFLTSHLSSFGALEIARADYRAQLAVAVERAACWLAAPSAPVLEAEMIMLRRLSQQREPEMERI